MKDTGHGAIPLAVCRLALAAVLLVFVVTGLRGIDFGYHWDEETCQLVPLRHSIQTGSPLPGFYMYPSINHWLNLAALLPDGIRGGDLLALTRSPGFLLRLRAIRLLVVALAPVWIFLAVRRWGGSAEEALFAAALLALSWESAYHARWVAPDSVTMQFAALTLLFSVCLTREPDRRLWRGVAALGAALACGTKYPAGLLLLPVLYAASQARERVRAVLETAAVFALGFLLTTPGTVLEPAKFLEDVRLMRDWYADFGLLGYSIAPGLPHLSRMAEYLGLVLFSPYPPVAFAVALLAVLGAIRVMRTERQAVVLLLLFPVAYLGYFSLQRVMVVRNLLLLAPFLVVLAARGLAWIGRPALAVGAAALLALNAVWLVRAGESIRYRGSDRYVAGLAAYVDARPARQFLVSPRVFEELARDGRTRPNLSRQLLPTTDAVVAHAFEAMRQMVEWPANVRGLTEATFGPQEVNFNYYPTWLGNDRILVMSLEGARKARVRLLRQAAP